MTDVIETSVLETSVTSGTGPYSLAGNVNGHRRVGDVCSIGDTMGYKAYAGSNFEEGIGTYSGTNTLSRTQVLRSTNGNAAVNWGSETKFVGLVVTGVKQSEVFGRLPRGHITGLTLSAAEGTSTLSILEGQASADTAPYPLLRLTANWGKTTAAFAQGSGNGAGTVSASTWYYIWLIGKLDGTADVQFSTSATSPTLPSGFVYKRRIGAFFTNGTGGIIGFQQFGDRVYYLVPQQELSDNSILANSQQFIPMNVPRVAGVHVLFRALIYHPSSSASVAFWPPFASATSLTRNSDVSLSIASGAYAAGSFEIPVNSSAQIKVTPNTSGINLSIASWGWVDRRGRDD